MEITQSDVTRLLLQWSYASYFLPTVQQANGHVWISNYLLLELMCGRMLISTHTLLCLASPHTPNFYCPQKCQEQDTADTPTTPPDTAIDSVGAPSNDHLRLAPQKWFARSLILEITAKAHLHVTMRQAKTLRWEIVWASSRYSFWKTNRILEKKGEKCKQCWGICSCKHELESPNGLRLRDLGLKLCDPVGLWLGQIIFFGPDSAAPAGPGNTMWQPLICTIYKMN